MTSRALFWTFAFINMAGAFCTALLGIYYVRKKEIQKHRRMMKASAVSIVFFVVAYAVKVFVLGREDLSPWSTSSVVILRIHESLVLTFLLAGFYAFRVSRSISGANSTAEAIARHRKIGRIAITAFALALFTAALTWNVILQQERGAKDKAPLALESPPLQRASVNLR